jgi:hypothetical protein
MRLNHLVAILGEAGEDGTLLAHRSAFSARRSAGTDDLLQHLILQPVNAEDADAIPVEEK